HRRRWRWFLALGAFLLVLGAAGISVASLLELTSVLVFGPMLLVSGILQLLTVLSAEKGKEALLHFVAAGLEAVLGFFIMAHPLQGGVSLVVLVALFLVISGLVRLARSVVTQPRGRGWTIMTGAVAILLGI